MAKQVNIRPIGAILLVTSFIFLILKIKLAIDNNAIEVKEAKPIQLKVHVHT